jgi:hypothetical protein
MKKKNSNKNNPHQNQITSRVHKELILGRKKPGERLFGFQGTHGANLTPKNPKFYFSKPFACTTQVA